jgi:hypothetical protein
MQIEIRKPISEYQKEHEWLFLYTILENPTRLICLLILLLLLVCESYYKNKTSTEPNTIYIGGICFWIGFLLWLGVILSAHRQRKKYRSLLALKSEYYVVLNDIGCERGVTDYWNENKNWGLLTGYTEFKKSFWLKFGWHDFSISKNDFKNVEDIEELRKFLKGKIAH